MQFKGPWWKAEHEKAPCTDTDTNEGGEEKYEEEVRKVGGDDKSIMVTTCEPDSADNGDSSNYFADLSMTVPASLGKRKRKRSSELKRRNREVNEECTVQEDEVLSNFYYDGDVEDTEKCLQHLPRLGRGSGSNSKGSSSSSSRADMRNSSS